MNHDEYITPEDITTIADLKRYSDGIHGDNWVLLIDGNPVNREDITFGYPADYGLWDEED